MANVVFAMLAHAGPHDLTGGGSLLHVMTSPEHMAMVGVLIAVGYAGYALFRRMPSNRRRRPAMRGPN